MAAVASEGYHETEEFIGDYSSSANSETEDQSRNENRSIASEKKKVTFNLPLKPSVNLLQVSDGDDTIPLTVLSERMAVLEEERKDWSVGSRLHDDGNCKPCAWNWKRAGCFKGAECVFCHACPAGAYLTQRKNRVTRLKVERFLRRAQRPGVFSTSMSL
jgi:hypothetical protein